MASSFFFYDLETSGISPREQRIMQFAGQRTDMNLQRIGEPFNIVVRLSDEIVPDPEAILVTGITPQQTLQDGITEADFLRIFADEIATPDTIFTGFNTVRFDDEFMRCTHYRNFYDPYEWQWRDGRGRWDLLDVVRMTRALRPDGIEWPMTPEGKPTNRLELITAANGLDHSNAHDALNDVYATIAVAELIRGKQPKLFDYLLSVRDKKSVASLVQAGDPFVYSSGKYPNEFEKTTVAQYLGDHPGKQGALVFDLRHDPARYADMSPQELADAWGWKKDRAEDDPALPVKTIQFNRCPAVAPLGVLDAASQKRIKIEMALVQANAKKLKASGLYPKLLEAIKLMDAGRQAHFAADTSGVDGQIYDGFFGDGDKPKLSVVRAADPKELDDLNLTFTDNRLRELLPLYKARNYPNLLTDEERQTWEEFRVARMLDGGDNSRLGKFFKRLGELAEDTSLDEDKRFLLEELQLYGQSIMPIQD